jgi:hypothetical protein
MDEVPQFLIHQESGNTIPLKEDQLIIAREWVTLLGKKIKGVEDAHAVLVRTKEKIFLRPLSGDTFLNGNRVTEEIALEHNCVLLFGSQKSGAVFVFKDLAQNARQQDTKRLRTMRFDFSVLKNAAEKMGRDLFNRAPASLIEFSDYLLNFLFEKFRIQRGVLYRVEESRWIPIRCRAMSSSFVPPKHILQKVWDKREPVHFELSETKETGDVSKSIVDSHIQSAICFPMINQGNLIGVLYIDTQQESTILSKDDLIMLCTLLPGVSGYMNALLSYERERLEADRNLMSLLPPVEPFPRVQTTLMNKGVQGFSLAIKGQDGLACTHVLLSQGKDNKDFALRSAAYGALLCAVTDPETNNVLDAAERVVKWFPTLKVSVGWCLLDAKTLHFSGRGGAAIVVKPPDRGAFMSDSHLEYEVKPGSYWALVSQKPEDLCTLFDRVKNIDRVKEDLRALASCVFCQIGG